jgi:hypothetical protein
MLVVMACFDRTDPSCHHTSRADVLSADLCIPHRYTVGMGMSFPRDTIILTDGMPREHQGIAASLINNVVHYSVSIILGIADTAIQQTNCGGSNVLGSY